MPKKLYLIIVHPADSFSTTDPVPVFIEHDKEVTKALAEIAIQFAAEQNINLDSFSWIEAFNDIPARYWKANGITVIGQDEPINACGWDFFHVYEADRLDEYA